MNHNLLVIFHQETKVRIMDNIHRTSGLDLHNIKEVWHNEVLWLLHMLSVVEHTQINVVMARHIASSMVKRVTS